ncbi:MAG: conserved rane protein of unknown function [Blastococcus sp.]|jgi:hypothetical protein|nr:conserved rane protein of unknown function [Blastococcus sp.]
MTSSLPPQPPSGGPQPGQGQQPPYGQQPPPYGQPGQAPPGYGPPPGFGRPGSPQPAGSGFSMDPKKLTMSTYVIAGGTLLYLVLALFPWWEFGDTFFGISYSLNGFSSGLVSSAFVLFLLATAWSALPAFYELTLGFPRAWVTVGLAGLGFLLTLFAWFDTFSVGFSIWALLGTLDALVITMFAVLTLLPELRNRPGQAGPTYAQSTYAQPTYGQPAPPPAAPPTYAPPPPSTPAAPPPYGPPAGGPPAPEPPSTV